VKVISHYLEVKPKEEVPGAAMREVITGDDGARNFSMRVFEVAPGGSTPFHSHPWEHEVFILSGQGTVKGGSRESQLTGGSVVFIPADEHHCFMNNSQSEPLHFVCLIPIQGACSLQ
jgi:quercetin dioxygenase-like cupin family protein|tara:strand:- start:59 stop:409 length:351 start_codon:yes stop_codon:yes gene_type:complete